MDSIWPTDRFFQLGYVTTDLARAMETMRSTQGVETFLTLDTRALAPPGSPGPFIKVALAWRGEVMIELIEPDASDTGIYGDALSPDGEIRLHHLGFLVSPERLSELGSELKISGIEVPVERQAVGISFLYADARARLGHYAEFVSPDEAGQRLFDSIPRY